MSFSTITAYGRMPSDSNKSGMKSKEEAGI
jgi:hypothetical protein